MLRHDARVALRGVRAAHSRHADQRRAGSAREGESEHQARRGVAGVRAMLKKVPFEVHQEPPPRLQHRQQRLLVRVQGLFAEPQWGRARAEPQARGLRA